MLMVLLLRRGRSAPLRRMRQGRSWLRDLAGGGLHTQLPPARRRTPAAAVRARRGHGMGLGGL